MSDTQVIIDPRIDTTPPAVPPTHTPTAAAPDTAESTMLDDLLEAIDAAVKSGPMYYPVPGLPGTELEADPNIPSKQLDLWQTRCTDRGRLDPLALAKLIVSTKVTGIFRNGTPVTFEGRKLAFYSPELWQALKVTSATAAVEKMITKDGGIAAVGDAILSDAGYGQSVEGQKDPTQG